MALQPHPIEPSIFRHQLLGHGECVRVALRYPWRPDASFTPEHGLVGVRGKQFLVAELQPVGATQHDVMAASGAAPQRVDHIEKQ
eukprot:5297588-Prymnesium_polylepis.1